MACDIAGGCACGHVRFRLKREPMFIHCCHCRSCQRETGAAFAVNALIESDQVELVRGTTERIDTPSASGQGQQIVRCPQCRIALWSHYAYAGIGDLVRFVRVGTLDDPDSMPPDVHIYVESKQPWVVLPDNTTAVAQYYSTKTLWPQASLERRQALFLKA